MIPSPYFGIQISIEMAEPPVQFHSGSTDRQSGEHPILSDLLPSSHTSGALHLELPQISHCDGLTSVLQ